MNEIEDKYSRFNDDGYGIRPAVSNGKLGQDIPIFLSAAGAKAPSGTLISYGEMTETIFELFGSDENAITKSLAWVMSRCPDFCKCIAERVFGNVQMSGEYFVYYQRYSSDNGITDIEVTDNENFHIIFEAKKGWQLPLYDQLQKYSGRKEFRSECTKYKKIVSMSECSTEYAENYLPKEIEGIEIMHLSWKDVFDCARKAGANLNNAGRKILDELCRYLEGVIGMQNYLSNEVYCVSLSDDFVSEGCSLRWSDIVLKYNRYTCPQGHGWPVEPPNYIAFRYKGRLLSVHHIKGYAITKNIKGYISEYPDITEEYLNFVFELGEAVKPFKEVKSGKNMRARRAWVMFDLLLTCDTVEEAVRKSKERKNQAANIILSGYHFETARNCVDFNTGEVL